ncbi:cytidylate kinase-like family protein [Blautia wexlerae]|nr:cytidylate kinase-like family protein [Blautia wexlerae]
MSERKYPVITISREFGAGGHSIARVVSERLGIPYYDRDFAKQAARQKRIFPGGY